MADKKSFLLYLDYEQHFSLLTDDELGKLIRAIFKYEAERTEPDFLNAPIIAMCFSFIKSQLDRDREEYERRCETNSANGRKGGRPSKDTKANGFKEKQQKAIGFSDNPTKAKKADNEDGTAYEKDYDIVTVDDNTRASTLLTTTEKQKLIDKYGADIVELYITKVSKYISEKRNGRPYADNAATVEKWILEDKAKGKLNNNGKSYDISDYENWLKDYRPKLSTD